MGIEVLDRDTPPDDPQQRAIWEATHALGEITAAALVERWGVGVTLHALIIRYTMLVESHGLIAGGVAQLEEIAAAWRAGRRLHHRDSEIGHG
jgi:hypothetical protein